MSAEAGVRLGLRHGGKMSDRSTIATVPTSCRSCRESVARALKELDGTAGVRVLDVTVSNSVVSAYVRSSGGGVEALLVDDLVQALNRSACHYVEVHVFGDYSAWRSVDATR